MVPRTPRLSCGSAIVALLQQLASGNYDIEVHSTNRKGEIGAVANTALVFKENGLAKIRIEAEQKEAEKRAAAQRRADILKLADGFEFRSWRDHRNGVVGVHRT